jgi:hypothetical protein
MFFDFYSVATGFDLLIVYKIIFPSMCMAVQRTEFHHFCTTQNALWWKCVCLERCKGEIKSQIKCHSTSLHRPGKLHHVLKT